MREKDFPQYAQYTTILTAFGVILRFGMGGAAGRTSQWAVLPLTRYAYRRGNSRKIKLELNGRRPRIKGLCVVHVPRREAAADAARSQMGEKDGEKSLPQACGSLRRPLERAAKTEKEGGGPGGKRAVGEQDQASNRLERY